MPVKKKYKNPGNYKEEEKKTELSVSRFRNKLFKKNNCSFFFC